MIDDTSMMMQIIGDRATGIFSPVPGGEILERRKLAGNVSRESNVTLSHLVVHGPRGVSRESRAWTCRTCREQSLGCSSISVFS